MINRIRDIRIQKGLTLADVAAACEPATTAQTIGRLETGMRNLSLVWMNRIAAALKVEPELLLRSEATEPARVVAILGHDGVEAPRREIEPVLPSDLSSDTGWLVLLIDTPSGEYRPGDQVWMRSHSSDDAMLLLNRDVLAPCPGGRFAYGRLVGREGENIAILPPASGQPPVLVEHPAWLAVAEMLVRKL